MLNDKLLKIQQGLKAPKNQYNTFGKYKYRSCEDIVEAVKPLCFEHNIVLTISDEIVEVGGRVYVKATAVLTDMEDKSLSVSAYAREPEDRKGMDVSQITGASSSYARKYALNGLFAIDDTKDADTIEGPGNGKTSEKQQPKAAEGAKRPLLTLNELCEKMTSSANVFELKARWSKYADDIKALAPEEKVKVQMKKDARKVELQEKEKNEPF